MPDADRRTRLGRLGRLVPEDPGVRSLALATLVNTTGNGIFFTLSALYFTRIVGLSVVQVGTGLSIAAGVAVLAGIPIGHLADRRGPREVQIALVSAVAVLSALFLLVTSWWQFVVLATLVAVLDRGASAVRQAMIAGLADGADRATTKAYLRSITNIGMTIGTGIAALALHADTRGAYLAVLYVDVASYAVAALVLTRVPHLPPTPPDRMQPMSTALRDGPFLAVVAVTGVLQMHFFIVEIALPLWVVGHTSAPAAAVSILLAINTVVVVAAQVAVAKRVATITAAVRATVVSGVLLLVTCTLFGLSGGLDPVAATAVLVVAMLVGVAAELWQSAASFLFAFELPPPDAMGQYQGAWGLGMAGASFLAPTTIALLPLGLGLPGWLALGAVLLSAALLTVPAVAWHTRRHAAPAPV